MIEAPLPRLPEGYYLDNFRELMDFVTAKYADILTVEELQIAQNFTALTVDAQRLYVRLISRRGPYFRWDKLVYQEISDIDAAVEELLSADFLVANLQEEIELAFQPITKLELVEFVEHNSDFFEIDRPKQLDKAYLLFEVLSHEETEVWKRIHQKWTLLHPLKQDLVYLFKLLFFGNTEQELHEFILEDIGILKYEPYEIRPEDRLYDDRSVVDGHLFLTQVRQQLWLAKEEAALDVVVTLGNILREYGLPEKLRFKAENIHNGIGRYLEKFHMWDEAISFYEMSSLHPARERTTRILEKTGELEAALQLCEKIKESSHHPEELAFAMMFGEKIKRKLELPYEKAKRTTYNKVTHETPQIEEQSVETTALQHYNTMGWSGFYTENVVWKALFGLVFWDIIFMPLPGVFFNPFQRGPADLFSSRFAKSRTDELENRLAEIDSSEAILALVNKQYEAKKMTANHLVNWKNCKLDHLQIVCTKVPIDHLKSVLVKMKESLRINRSGFPDLFLYNENEYRLVEVKGPGDQLQPNQKNWLQYFEKSNIPYEVAHIKWSK